MIAHTYEHILLLSYLLVSLLYLPVLLCVLFHIHMAIDTCIISYMMLDTLIHSICYIVGIGEVNNGLKYILWEFLFRLDASTDLFGFVGQYLGRDRHLVCLWAST